MSFRLVHQFLLRIGVIGATAGWPAGAAANDNGIGVAADSPAREIAQDHIRLDERGSAMLERLVAAGDARIDRALPGFIASLLDRATSFERITLVADWTTRPERDLRRAMAAALGRCRDGVGLRAAIEHLASDEDAVVRRAAARAAGVHLGEDPARYTATLERLTTDVDDEVRELAGTALRA